MKPHPLPPGSRGTAMVIGATSAIARPCLKVLQEAGYDLCLTCRSLEKVQQIKAELLALSSSSSFSDRLPQICGLAFTLPCTSKEADELLARCQAAAPSPITLVMVAAAAYAQTPQLEQSPEQEQELLQINFNSVIALLQSARCAFAAADSLPARPALVVITSVAGVRGRGSNYAYGASKAALSAWLSGLRQAHREIRVIELRPGLIAGPMLRGRDLPHLLIAGPECVARALRRCLAGRRDVCWVPWWWRLIMLPLQLLPECIYRRLDL